MLCLSQLKAAKPGQIAIDYEEVNGDAELTCRSVDANLVSALHAWFDAQLSDHEREAMAREHHRHGEKPPR